MPAAAASTMPPASPARRRSRDGAAVTKGDALNIDAFGETGVVDIVGVCGYYMLVSMTLNVFEMPLPPGEPDPIA